MWLRNVGKERPQRCNLLPGRVMQGIEMPRTSGPGPGAAYLEVAIVPSVVSLPAQELMLEP